MTPNAIFIEFSTYFSGLLKLTRIRNAGVTGSNPVSAAAHIRNAPKKPQKSALYWFLAVSLNLILFRRDPLKFGHEQ
jgi:hypothetical protein